MTVDYRFYLRQNDRFGVKKAHSIIDMTSFRYRQSLLGGSLTLTVHESNRIAQNVVNFDQFQVFWQNDAIGVPRSLDFTGIFREPTTSTDEPGITNKRFVCERDTSILSYRGIMYDSGKVGFSSFTAVPAETVAKTIVLQNLTAIATIPNGRKRAGDLAPGMGMTITAAPDLGLGNLITRKFQQGQVLRILEDIQQTAGGYFVLNNIGGSAWEFDFVPQLADDKSSGPDRVLFSLKRGNLLTPSLTVRRIGTATVAVAAGKGKKDVREFIEVLGPDYAPNNDIEMFVNASNQSGAGLASLASEKLEEKREKRDFNFEVIQTENTFYSPVDVPGRKTYKLGTIVAVDYNDSVIPRQITAVTITGSGGQNPTYKFDIETVDL